MAKNILLVVFSAVCVYAIFAFVSLQPDVRTWSPEWRYWLVVFSAIVSSGAILFWEKPHTS